MEKGRYVYGIAARGSARRLGAIGIADSEVYTIPYRELCAIVHDCSTEPYQSHDDEMVKKWAWTHQHVLDQARQQLGTVIPLAFDTILKAQDAARPDQVVADWLREDYRQLQTLMKKIEGKDEYAVQVSYEAGLIGRQVSEQNQEIQEIKAEMGSKPPGTAYLYRSKLEKAVRAEMERWANERFEELYARIKRHCDDTVVEKTRKLDNGRVMLLSLSCLVARERVEALGAQLQEVQAMPGFSVHSSGPWPPYSFVAKPMVQFEEATK